MRWRRVPLLFLRAGREFLNDNCSHMAAAVSYYALFSIFPLLLALVSLMGFFLGGTEIEERMVNEIVGFLPVSQDLIAGTLRGVIAAREETGIVALGSLIWAASGLFSALTYALNAVWHVSPTRPFWRQQLVVLAMFVWVGFLLLSSTVVTAAVVLIKRFEVPLWSQLVEGWGWSTELGLALVPVLLAFATFWVLYHLVPQAPARWSDLWLGALIAALGFEGGKRLFVWYLGAFASYNAVYGPLSAVVVFLAWSYLSTAIVLFGAEVASEYPKVMA